jgi:phosphotransferase system  glucose/maltose/N-acetylglucosamine-specific IIC component
LVIFGYFWLFLVIFGYFWLFLVISVCAIADGVFCLFTGGTERFDWNAPGSFERTTLRRTATCGCARVWGRMATV